MDNYREAFLIQQIYTTIFSLTNKIQVKEAKYFDKLSSRQLMAIIAIYHLPEDKATLNNIAKKLGTTKQSVKQIITILENKGYVVTMPSKIDKRAVNVSVTEAGRRETIESGKESMYFFAEISKSLTKEEMEILWILLKKMYSFDGEEMDGFEENVNTRVEIDEEELEKENENLLKEFGKIRSGEIKNE
ncbi:MULTISPECIES: MarR family winged helix-turn-helix transcriptional regulator [Clostridium]|uniref:MarR family winged helix-turn-helix transcriptional regulator n=1 Tax=Clostridium TaxID=1485 RepID=UPI0008259A37|nr:MULTISPECIES: MarR family winged helix-turn-helix transcriptional regulator [Clostridium]PJI10311.1 MarR family transcriptional regulator [Clostridium sp. CT7]